MDWVSATYNRFETLAVAADRTLGMLVERCEDWLAARGAKRALPPKHVGQGGNKPQPRRPISV
jgi:hypothetical protein